MATTTNSETIQLGTFTDHSIQSVVIEYHTDDKGSGIFVHFTESDKVGMINRVLADELSFRDEESVYPSRTKSCDVCGTEGFRESKWTVVLNVARLYETIKDTTYDSSSYITMCPRCYRVITDHIEQLIIDHRPQIVATVI